MNESNDQNSRRDAHAENATDSADESIDKSGQEQQPDVEVDAGAVPPEPEGEENTRLAEENSRLKETLLRQRAEMDNREKRLEREMAKTRKFALESLMRDLVPVLDSLDQALAAGDPGDAPAAYEGMELTRKQAIQVLTQHGLEVLDPIGEPFDPSWHEAVTTQPTTEEAPDSVLQVLQKGYRLNERLLRPARVIVARAP